MKRDLFSRSRVGTALAFAVTFAASGCRETPMTLTLKPKLSVNGADSGSGHDAGDGHDVGGGGNDVPLDVRCPEKRKPDPKEILLYAPDIYQPIAGQKNQNTYLAAVIADLQSWGYSTTIESRVDVNMDSCDLYNKYAQVWLYLPCSNRQVITNSTAYAVKAYYDAGRGVAIWGDSHFFNGTTLNDHCTVLAAENSRAYYGTTAEPSSLAKLVEIVFQSRLDYLPSSSTSGVLESVAAGHPLESYFKSISLQWSVPFSLKQQGPVAFKALSSGIKSSNRFVVEDSADRALRRRAFLSVSDYNYHALGLSASNLASLHDSVRSAICRVAEYFSGRKGSCDSISTSSSKGQLALAERKKASVATIVDAAKKPDDKSQTVRITLSLYDIDGTEPEEEIVPALVQLLRFPITSVRHQAAALLLQHWSKSPLVHELTAHPASFGQGESFAELLHGQLSE